MAVNVIELVNLALRDTGLRCVGGQMEWDTDLFFGTFAVGPWRTTLKVDGRVIRRGQYGDLKLLADVIWVDLSPWAMPRLWRVRDGVSYGAVGDVGFDGNGSPVSEFAEAWL